MTRKERKRSNMLDKLAIDYKAARIIINYLTGKR